MTKLDIEKFKKWMRENGVRNTYNGYSKDLEDIRNGVIGNYSAIQNINAKSAFNDQNVRNLIRTNSLFGIDFFELSNLASLIQNLKKFDNIFFKKQLSSVFQNYNKKSANNQPRAAIRKYIEYLEKSHSNKQFDNYSDSDSVIIDLDVEMPDKTIYNEPFLNIIFFGPPGTGKTYNTINKAIEIIDFDFYNKNKDRRDLLTEKYRVLQEEKQIFFTTFHQSLNYEDFIEGIRPTLKKDQVIYEVKSGIFKQVAKLAEKENNKNFVLIIDEINRGNVAGIFGELITLIEPNKRKKIKEVEIIDENNEELTTILPYSNELFSVPDNLYIIGTMNTADRSVEALDTALRRRFVFEEMQPNYNLKELNENFFGINLKIVLEKINSRIEKLIDKDHLIGHSFFLNLKTINDLRNSFENKIIPLLEEYFYGDFVKIGLILGKDFVTLKKFNYGFANFDDDSLFTDLGDRNTYIIKTPEEDEVFVNALKNI